MLNAIIVDDEEFARSSLYFLLQENCPEINITGIAKSVSDARAIVSSTPVDVIFLDIAMPGENGFSLLDQPAAAEAAIIFTTAYDQYALKAIKANAMDYLLKPIDIDELKTAVQKAVKAVNNKTARPALTIGDQLAENGEIKKLTLPSGQGYRIVDTDQIVYIEADSNYSIFHLKNKEKIVVSRVLKDYEEVLPESKFLRIHKSTIVNFDYITEYNSKAGLKIVLNNGETIPVSRRRTGEFFDKLRTYTNIKGEK